MTPQMEKFLNEFAELLEKHDVEFEISEDKSGWEKYCDGITIYQDGIYDQGKGRKYCELTLPRLFNSDDIVDFIEENR